MAVAGEVIASVEGAARHRRAVATVVAAAARRREPCAAGALRRTCLELRRIDDGIAYDNGAIGVAVAGRDAANNSNINEMDRIIGTSPPAILIENRTNAKE